jgi:glycosyltransferase involved in cell wall biosynthesis
MSDNRVSEMKVVLLVLSGDRDGARDYLAATYPHAFIETVSRNEVGLGSFAARLKTLRALRPDIFAIATERLAWQRGQNLLMLFGAIAGASEVLMIDSHGGVIKKSRASLLLGSPVRLSKEALTSAMTFANARHELIRLEQEVEKTKLSPRRLSINPANPKVVYIRSTPGPGTQFGGAASHIKGVIEALLELGATVEVVSNDVIAGLAGTKVPLTVLQPESFGGTRALFDINSNLEFTRRAVPLIKQAKPDFIYQRYARFGWTGVVSALRAERPLFLEYNGSEVWVGRHWDSVGSLDLLARYEELNLRAAARIFVVSAVELRNLEARGVPSDKITVNPNGVDTDLFRPGTGGGNLRRALGVGPDEVMVGFVGTFGPWHGVLTLAEAIKAIPVTVPVRFVLIGSGSLHGEVEQLLKVECQSRRVIFTGAVEHERVPALLDACEILVAPHVPLTDGSEFFGSPTKLFEYMAMGKAIVASRLGQIGEVLDDEETALLVEPGDAKALAAAIVRLVGSREFRSTIGENARAQALQTYTWKHNARRVLEAYRSWADKG